MDQYGTQKSIALLKFLFERGGVYGRGKDLKWKNIKDIGMYVCMCVCVCVSMDCPPCTFQFYVPNFV